LEGKTVVKQILTLVAGAALVFAIAQTALGADALKVVKTVTPRNSVFILSYFGGRDAGIWSKRGIDIQIDARPFAGYVASIPSKEVPVATYAGTAGIAHINKGLDLVVIGGGLTVMQEVFVKKDSPVKSINDLRGKKFGVWNTGAGASKALRAALIDAYKFDYSKDAEVVQAAGPALLALLKRGDVDSMFNISSFTIAAATEPGNYRSIFIPNDFWKTKTGSPIVWSAPLMAYREWIEEDPERAKNYALATMESFDWLRDPENFDKAAKKYGKLAGIKSAAEAKTYKDWLQKKKLFLSEWNQKIVDAQWAFLEMAAKTGALGKVPDMKKHAMVLQ